LFKAATCEAGLHPRVDRVADDAVGEHVLDRAAVQLAPVAGHLLLAVINVAAAVVALAWRGPTALVLAWVVAVWALAAGFAEIVAAFAGGETAGIRAMLAATGLVSVAFGVVLAARPDIGAFTLALLFGLYSLVYGVSEIVLGAQMRPAGHSISQDLQAA
jgi:uncharacterized membrane protein HdeD (DUF308 family)